MQGAFLPLSGAPHLVEETVKRPGCNAFAGPAKKLSKVILSIKRSGPDVKDIRGFRLACGTGNVK